MITLESIQVFGKSTAGNFSGELSFKSGLQVISADNAFGKSLSVTTVAWCLGAETVFGLPDNDPVASRSPSGKRSNSTVSPMVSSPHLAQ